MSSQVIGLIAMVGLFALIMLRVPVAIAMGIAGMLGYAAIDGWETAIATAASTPYDLTQRYALTVVPLFILMGVVASRAGMSRELFQAANAIFSGVRGALAMAAVGACAGFGAICGSSLATAATMSRVAIPEMRSHGYSESIATGVVASAGILGVLIPPSVVLVVYAIIAEQGVPQLFAAALIPGLLGAALHLVVILGIARFSPSAIPLTPTMPWSERLREFYKFWKMALLFLIAVGGIYSGFMSPTEAAAVAALVAIIIAMTSGALDFRGLLESLLETVWTTAMLFVIVVGAFYFSYFIALTQLPNAITEYFKALNVAPFVIILLMVAFYVALGFFLDAISMILITVPVFLPLAEGIGYDGIWFGILVLVSVEIGMITPPVGLNIFVIKGQMPDIALGDIYRGVVPFLLAHFGLIALLMTLPFIATWLPTVLY